MYSICTVYVQYMYASEAYKYCTYTVQILYICQGKTGQNTVLTELPRAGLLHSLHRSL